MTRLDDLALRWQEDDLDADEVAELRALLAGSESRARFMLHLSLTTALGAIAGGLAQAPAEPARRRARTLRWWLVASVAAAAALIAMAIARAQPARDGGLRVLACAGAAWIERTGARTPATVGARLRAGERAATDSGRLTVTWSDGGTLLLRPDTTLTQRDDAARELRIDRGDIDADVAHQPPGSVLRFTTPTAAAEVIGTRFVLRVDDATTRLAVDQGRVRLRRAADGATVEVGAGEQALAARDDDAALRARPAAASERGLVYRRVLADDVADSAGARRDQPQARIVAVHAPWDRLEPRPGEFVLAGLDADVADAERFGYRLIIALAAGVHAPDWLYGLGVQRFDGFGPYASGPDFAQPMHLPVPWDPRLAERYDALLTRLAGWLAEPDGAGGRKSDHVLALHVALPSAVWTGMFVTSGDDTALPDGRTLVAANRAAWDALAPLAERRARLRAAWSRAVALHLERVPAPVRALLSLGDVFGDRDATGAHLVAEHAGEWGPRVIVAYPNLQAVPADDGGFTPWATRFPARDRALRAARAAGCAICFQLQTRKTDDEARLAAACDQAIDVYGASLLVADPSLFARFHAPLVDAPDSVQDRLQR